MKTRHSFGNLRRNFKKKLYNIIKMDKIALFPPIFSGAQEMDKEPMTVTGHLALKERLKHLISVERPAVIRAIEEARGHGDLSENAEYDAAKEQQSHIEGRIQQIQGKMAIAQVIDPSQMNSEKITFGATVTVFDINTEEEFSYQIVGEDEADIKKGKISIKSPFARAMIGKREEAEIVFRAPGGLRELEVLKVEYK